jgi:SAM-dependent methyltransferase
MGSETRSFEKTQGGEPVKAAFSAATETGQDPVRLSAAEGYRLWSRTYDREPNPLTALEFRTLAPRLGGIAGKVFVDVACGTGRWMMEAVSRGANTFGLDVCREMLAVAGVKPRLAGRLMEADGRSLPLRDELADLVMCSFSVGYIRPLYLVFHELCRVAKRGATILVSDLHPGARQSGWRRSFRSGSKVFEIESFLYTADALIAAGTDAGMRLRQILEPALGEPELQLVRDAGKEVLLDQIFDVPAVLILEWERI